MFKCSGVPGVHSAVTEKPSKSGLKLSFRSICFRSVQYDEKAEEVVLLLTPDKELPPIPSGASTPSPKSTRPSGINSALDKLDSLVYSGAADADAAEPAPAPGIEVTSSEKSPVPNRLTETYYDPVSSVHYFNDGHYWLEVSAIDASSALEELPAACYKPPNRLRFSTQPVIMFSTHSVDDYDRRNDEVSMP